MNLPRVAGKKAYVAGFALTVGLTGRMYIVKEPPDRWRYREEGKIRQSLPPVKTRAGVMLF